MDGLLLIAQFTSPPVQTTAREHHPAHVSPSRITETNRCYDSSIQGATEQLIPDLLFNLDWGENMYANRAELNPTAQQGQITKSKV